MAAESITGRSAACRSSSVAAAFDGLVDLVGELPVGAVLEPLGALGRGLGEQRLEVDRRGRAVLLLRLDRHRAAGRGLEPEAHHRLVDRADLLHVERAVGDALAVEDEELLERAVDRAVGDKRRLDALVDLARAAAGTALEELEAVGVEEDAVALAKRMKTSRRITVRSARYTWSGCSASDSCSSSPFEASWAAWNPRSSS